MSDFVLMTLVAWGPWLVLAGIGLYVGLRYVRSQEARAHDRAEMAALSDRVLALEEKMLDMTAERERVLEGQRFASELLPTRALRKSAE